MRRGLSMPVARRVCGCSCARMGSGSWRWLGDWAKDSKGVLCYDPRMILSQLVQHLDDMPQLARPIYLYAVIFVGSGTLRPDDPTLLYAVRCIAP
ncbi:hypothetical protein POSPLADRAFT_1177153 [Postia placenta MAD-698-R-SB12]|uniref:Uncharacterized protein n=1 Tax=Postia placenta MAD-698-R-SB12 TaxID=670580 RepID=A0A1X6NHP7_9APHY|nr:hypothetical protein POSPLADRAFT_1177153 [Postia placenta MAD-698-R-SB12]OSX68134.1 hypothetical protein POSPLADRAFT_1177153 [Postia placenta MAD-698-R-SB12]